MNSRDTPLGKQSGAGTKALGGTALSGSRLNVLGTRGAVTNSITGTFTLAIVFLLAFVLYYFINWKYLATVWGLS